MPGIGEQLKQARAARGLTIKQVMQSTRIRAYYLEAMESDDFAAMPSAAQTRGFLRSYAEFLGLNAAELIDRQRDESAAPAEFSAPTDQLPPPPAIQEPEPEPAPPEPAPEPPVSEPAAEEPPTPDSPTISQVIFLEIGSQLRQRRELLSLTYDEIERHTRIRKHYLIAIETGDFDELPSPVQARGMLSAYAGFLDMDFESLLLRFADGLQVRRVERQAKLPQKSSLPPQRVLLPLWLRRFISPDLIFGGSMILTLLGLSLWGAGRILSSQESKQTQGPSISDVLLASPVVTGEITPDSPTGVAELGTPLPDLSAEPVIPTGTLAFFGQGASAVQITLSVLERTFLRVLVDGEVKQDGRVAPGVALSFTGARRVEILTGSGAAVRVMYNQRDEGIMGNFGEVINRIYTVTGIETPTPTSSPTPTVTLRPSVTPLPTRTLRPSSTPRPSATPKISPTPNP